MQGLLENSLEVSVRCKDKHGFGVASFSFLDVIVKKEEQGDIDIIYLHRNELF